MIAILLLVVLVAMPFGVNSQIIEECPADTAEPYYQWVLNPTLHRCYKIFEYANFTFAQKCCQDLNGTFVQINDTEQLTNLRNLFNRSAVYGTWINAVMKEGAVDPKDPSSYVLTDGKPIPNVMNWCPNFPVGLATAKCVVAMCPYKKNYCCMSNRNCDRIFISFCEVPSILIDRSGGTTPTPLPPARRGCQYSDGQRLDTTKFSFTSLGTQKIASGLKYPNRECCNICYNQFPDECTAFDLNKNAATCTFFSSATPIKEVLTVSKFATGFLSGAPYPK